MTLLLTGATGLIGREFLALGCARSEIVAVARDPPSAGRGTGDGAVEWLAVDLRDGGFARRLPGRITAIVHLAQSGEYRRFPEGAVDVADVNLGATARLLDYGRGAGAQRFVFASTGTVYEPSHSPLGEAAQVHCTSYYAASKRAAELLIEQYRDLMRCWLLRIFTVYGPGAREQLIANLVRRIEAGEPVTVEGRAGLRVSPIHAADVSRVLWQAADGVESVGGVGAEVVNVGGREALGIRELAEEIGRAVGAAPRFADSGSADPPGWIASRAKLERLFALPEPLSFATGIRETLAARNAGAVSG